MEITNQKQPDLNFINIPLTTRTRYLKNKKQIDNSLKIALITSGTLASLGLSYLTYHHFFSTKITVPLPAPTHIWQYPAAFGILAALTYFINLQVSKKNQQNISNESLEYSHFLVESLLEKNHSNNYQKKIIENFCDYAITENENSALKIVLSCVNNKNILNKYFCEKIINKCLSNENLVIPCFKILHDDICVDLNNSALLITDELCDKLDKFSFYLKQNPDLFFSDKELRNSLLSIIDLLLKNGHSNNRIEGIIENFYDCLLKSGKKIALEVPFICILRKNKLNRKICNKIIKQTISNDIAIAFALECLNKFKGISAENLSNFSKNTYIKIVIQIWNQVKNSETKINDLAIPLANFCMNEISTLNSDITDYESSECKASSANEKIKSKIILFIEILEKIWEEIKDSDKAKEFPSEFFEINTFNKQMNHNNYEEIISIDL